jgi:serine/threonine protein kinase/tetratricopeptide (TPR) repeat protein
MLRSGDEPIPGYRLEVLLGRGGFGEVWRATAPGGTHAALKFINLSGKHGVKEYRAIQRVKEIRHANLLPINAFWMLDDRGGVIEDARLAASATAVASRTVSRLHAADPTTFSVRPTALVVAMLLGDKSLYDRLEECRAADGSPGGIPPDELLDQMEDAAKGIDFLNSARHDLGEGPVALQHCDIKPQNLLLVGTSVLVCDFGLARVLGDQAAAQSTTGAAGSPAYMAPECIRDQRPSHATDQYSLAITYYELRTGRLPFDAETYVGVMDVHLKGLLDLSRLPAAEQAVIRRATEMDPKNRFPSALALVRALRKAVTGETVAGSTLLGSTTIGSGGIATTGLGGLATTGSGGLPADGRPDGEHLGRRDPRVARSGRTAPRPTRGRVFTVLAVLVIAGAGVGAWALPSQWRTWVFSSHGENGPRDTDPVLRPPERSPVDPVPPVHHDPGPQDDRPTNVPPTIALVVRIEPAAATVSVDGRAVVPDAEGRLTLRAAVGQSLELTARHAEYRPYSGRIELPDDGEELVIRLTRDAAYYLRVAGEAAAAGQAQQAIDLLTDGAAQNPDERDRFREPLATLHVSQGEVQREAGQLAEAIVHFDAAIALDSRNAAALRGRGRAHAASRQADKALADLDESIRLENHPVALAERAKLLIERGDHRRAIDDLNAAIALESTVAAFYINRGFANNALGEHQRAIDDLTVAIRLDATNPVAYHNRAFAFGRLRRFDEAIADYRLAIRHHRGPYEQAAQGLAAVLAGRGQTRLEAERYTEAIADFTEAIGLRPELAALYTLRATAYLENSDATLAIMDASKAIQLDSDYAEAYRVRADAYKLRGDPGDAERAAADLDRAEGKTADDSAARDTSG